MTVRKYVYSTLMAALVVMAVGGFLMHTGFHPVSVNQANYTPVVSGILSIAIVPLLFSSKKTLSYGYVLNGMLVILGTMTMVHYSIAHLHGTVTVGTILHGTNLAVGLLLWGKFFVGKALFDLETFGYHADAEKKGAWLRYPNYGWWAAHVLAIPLVYLLGHYIWR